MQSFKYDLLLHGGTVVDPQNGVCGRYDLAIKDGKIAAVAPELDKTLAQDALDVSGLHVLPGIFDTHVHLSPRHSGEYGYRMLAQAGVTTTLEISGPIDGTLDLAAQSSVGINMALLDQIRPGMTVPNDNPSEHEVEAFIDRCLAKGGLGVKMLGGHYPLTPEATANTIAAAYKCKAYVAFHAGTKATGSDLRGGLEAIELAAGKPLHLAHVNSYCRGSIKPNWQEAEDMLEALTNNPNIRAESYLAAINGCGSKCTNGVPDSLVTQRCLKVGGFEPTEAGMEQAILAGWAQINVHGSGQIDLATGPSALEYWRSKGTDGEVSFSVNPPEARYRLAVAKKADGSFVVDCLATDGGAIPRNVIVPMGLGLVNLQAWTISDFVTKTSINPAKWFNLSNKGHFSEGADADITIVSLQEQKPLMTIVDGNVVMHKGAIIPRKMKIITTAQGEAAIRARGFEAHVIDIAETAYFKGMK